MIKSFASAETKCRSSLNSNARFLINSIVSCLLLELKGGEPYSISYIRIPRHQISILQSYSSLLTISGAKSIANYIHVRPLSSCNSKIIQSIVPQIVLLLSLIVCTAHPKSLILSSPLSSTRIFSNFKSINRYPKLKEHVYLCGSHFLPANTQRLKRADTYTIKII